MESSQVIETIGNITKLEKLIDLKTDVQKNSLVLKNIKPFSGIANQNISIGNKPGSLFVILRYRYAPEKINRINCKMFQELKLAVNPSYGEINTSKGVLPCVRIKGLSNYSDIKRIQEYLFHNDLQLMPHRKIEEVCRIKIFKFFKLSEIGNGLYRDLVDEEKFYIRINKNLNWKSFDYVTKKIKFNMDNSEFDAALGIIYRFTGPENVIRIYDKDTSYKRSVELRKAYLKEVKSEIHLSAVHN